MFWLFLTSQLQIRIGQVAAIPTDNVLGASLRPDPDGSTELNEIEKPPDLTALEDLLRLPKAEPLTIAEQNRQTEIIEQCILVADADCIAHILREKPQLVLPNYAQSLRTLLVSSFSTFQELIVLYHNSRDIIKVKNSNAGRKITNVFRIIRDLYDHNYDFKKCDSAGIDAIYFLVGFIQGNINHWKARPFAAIDTMDKLHICHCKKIFNTFAKPHIPQELLNQISIRADSIDKITTQNSNYLFAPEKLKPQELMHAMEIFHETMHCHSEWLKRVAQMRDETEKDFHYSFFNVGGTITCLLFIIFVMRILVQKKRNILKKQDHSLPDDSSSEENKPVAKSKKNPASATPESFSLGYSSTSTDDKPRRIIEKKVKEDKTAFVQERLKARKKEREEKMKAAKTNKPPNQPKSIKPVKPKLQPKTKEDVHTNDEDNSTDAKKTQSISFDAMVWLHSKKITTLCQQLELKESIAAPQTYREKHFEILFHIGRLYLAISLGLRTQGKQSTLLKIAEDMRNIITHHASEVTPDLLINSKENLLAEIAGDLANYKKLTRHEIFPDTDYQKSIEQNILYTTFSEWESSVPHAAIVGRDTLQNIKVQEDTIFIQWIINNIIPFALSVKDKDHAIQVAALAMAGEYFKADRRARFHQRVQIGSMPQYIFDFLDHASVIRNKAYHEVILPKQEINAAYHALANATHVPDVSRQFIDFRIRLLFAKCQVVAPLVTTAKAAEQKTNSQTTTVKPKTFALSAHAKPFVPSFFAGSAATTVKDNTKKAPVTSITPASPSASNA